MVQKPLVLVDLALLDGCALPIDPHGLRKGVFLFIGQRLRLIFCVVKEVRRLDNAALAVIAVIVDVLNCVDLQSSRHFPDSL